VIEHHLRYGNAQRAGGPVAVLAQGIDGVVDFAEGRGDAFEEGVARLGQADATRGPVQQAHAHVVFELPQCLAERGGRDFQLGSGAGEAPVAGDQAEGAQSGRVVLSQ
jgi:hypothetical protein